MTNSPQNEGKDRKWRKLHDEQLSNLYCPTTIIRMFKFKKTKGRKR